MDITQAQFWDAPNQAGLPTFSYDELVAQIIVTLQAQGVAGNPNIGIGCHATSSSQSIPGGGRIRVPFDGLIYDDANFVDLAGATPERMTIPDLDPPIERVIIGGFQNWGASTNGTERDITFVHNLNEVTGGSQDLRSINPVPGPSNRILAKSPPIDVVAGDFFEVQAVISGGAAASVSMSGAGWLIVIR